MIPLQLTLKNFLSYRDEVSIDLSPIRIACLSGDNGAGKSALLDAMTWALWGKARSNNDRDMVSINAAEMEVTYAFRLGDREYRVFRRRSFAGASKHTVEVDVRAIGDTAWSSMTGDSVSHTQRKINHLLSLEYDTFIHSAFILQGKADAFTEKSPTERKKILGEILNLQEYDVLAKSARDRANTLGRELASIHGQMGELDDQLVVRQVVEEELTITGQRLTELGQQLDLAALREQSLAVQLREHDMYQQQIVEGSQRETRETAARDSERARRDGQIRERDQLVETVAHADEIEHGWAELQRWHAEVVRLNELARGDQEFQRTIHAAEREIDGERATIQRAADRHQQAAQAARDALALCEQQRIRLAELTTRIDAVGDAGASLAQVASDLDRLRQKYAGLTSENKQLAIQNEEITANLELLKIEDADCPTCHRPLSDHDREHVRDNLLRDADTIRRRHKANTEQLAEIKVQGDALRKEQQALEKTLRELSGHRALVTQITEELKREDGIRAQLAEDEQAHARALKLLDTETFAEPARQRLLIARTEQQKLGYDPRVAAEAAKHERDLQPFAERKTALDRARADISRCDAVIAEMDKNIAAMEANLAETSRALHLLRKEHPIDPDLRDRALAATDEVERFRREKSALEQEQGRLGGRIRDLDALQERRDELDVKATEIELDESAARILGEAFGRNGIQALVIESVLPELEDEANELLRKMSNGQLEVSIRTQKQALSTDKVIETLDIEIRDEAGKRPYQLYSGGEAFRINFAVRVALSKLLARRAGASIDMLVIDEGFGTQDSQGRDGLIEALHSIEADFQTILVITHIGEIRDMFPSRIDVVKTDRGSQVVVV